MAKTPKPNKSETVSDYYGIHHDTLEVVNISVTRGLTATRHLPNYAVTSIRENSAYEVGLHFRLFDVIEQHPRFDDPKEVQALQAKAAQLRADRDKAAGGQDGGG